ncbi:DNA mismatch repair protein MutT, partial [Prosthecomicrobium hirschii]
LPGGGVDPGESAGRALVRELEEEGGLRVEESRIFGLYLNSRTSRRDHVALFVVDAFTMSPSPFVPNAEIREVGFFPLDALPEETTGATRRRIAEVVEGAPRADIW